MTVDDTRSNVEMADAITPYGDGHPTILNNDDMHEAARRLRAMPDDPLSDREVCIAAQLYSLSREFAAGKTLRISIFPNGGVRTWVVSGCEPPFVVPSNSATATVCYRYCVEWVRTNRAALAPTSNDVLDAMPAGEPSAIQAEAYYERIELAPKESTNAS